MGQKWKDHESVRLVETASLPVFYIDDVLSVEVCGPIVHVISFEFRRFAGELVKVPVVEIIRPVAVDLPGNIQRLLRLEVAGQGGLH